MSEHDTAPPEEPHVRADRSQGGEQNKQPPEDNWERRHSLITLWFNAMLTLLAVVGGCSVWWQLKKTDEQLRLTDEQLRLTRESNKTATDTLQFAKDEAASSQADVIRSLNAAEDAAAASDRLAKIASTQLGQARDAFRLDKRAWVGTVRIERVVMEEGKAFSVAMRIKNTGTTPALDIRTVMAATALPRGRVFSEEMATYSQPPTPDSWSVLQPQGEMTLPITSDAIMTKLDIDWLKEGVFVEHIYGQIRYRDIFREAHVSTFCVFLRPPDFTTGAGNCHAYNTAY